MPDFACKATLALYTMGIKLLLVVSSLAVAEALVIHPPPLPADWAVDGAADPEAAIEVRFSVKEQNIDALKNISRAVSDPHSGLYGAFLSQAAVDRLVAPKPRISPPSWAGCARLCRRMRASEPRKRSSQ